jgi:hypothetical protein
VAKRDRDRQQELGSFLDLCETTAFGLEPRQVKIASAAPAGRVDNPLRRPASPQVGRREKPENPEKGAGDFRAMYTPSYLLPLCAW